MTLLHSLSWHAGKVFKRQGILNRYLWMTVDVSGRRTWFETAAFPPPDAGDAEALAMLRAELREDFHCDAIVAYGVAYPGTYTEVLTSCILLSEPTDRCQSQVVALEAHTADEHLRTHRAIVTGSGKPYLANLAPITDGGCQFGELC